MNITTEWFFDPLYDEQSVDLIQGALNERISEWIDSTYEKLREHMIKHPTQKCAASFESSQTEAVICGGPVSFLTGLICDDVPWHKPTKLPDPWELVFRCVVYVGPQKSIIKKRREIMDQLADHFNQSGVEGCIVEKDIGGDAGDA
jgi:hypothetical protein